MSDMRSLTEKARNHCRGRERRCAAADARTMKPQRSMRQALIAAFAVVTMALAFGVLASGAVTPAYADEATAPATSKTLVDNGDGTYSLSLSVTGASQTSQTSGKADVIVVLDLSGSMTYQQGRSTRLAIAKSAVNQLASQLLSNNTAASPDAVTLSLVTFSNYATTQTTQTTDLADFQRTVNGLRAAGGTNWEDALQTANGITTRSDADTYVIFVSDGDPTFRNTRDAFISFSDENERHQSDGHVYYGSGNSDNNGKNYKFASQQAEAISVAGKTLYSIGVFGNVSNMQSLAAAAGQADNYYSATDQQGLTDAFDDIVNQITNNLSYTDVSIIDGLTSLTATTLVPGETGGFTYTKTENGATTSWADAPAARYNGSSVSWDLSSLGSLEHGVTYTVSFTVHPSQEAIDVIAQLENGTLTLEDANARYGNQFAQTADDSFGLKTNTSASVGFTQTQTTTTKALPADAQKQSDGTWHSASTGLTYTYDEEDERYVATTSVTGSATMTEPGPLPISTPTISVAKTWVDSLDESVRPAGDITFDIMLDGTTKLASVTLNAQNGYRTDVHVPYGITVDDTDLTSGHDVALAETNLDSHYEFATETVRPMMVDGDLVLGGDGDSTVTGSNTLKGRITITKQAEGEGYPADAAFDYDITVNAPNGTATLPYTVYAADGATVAATGSITSGTKATVTIGAGQKIVIDSVPVGTTYTVTESSSPAGWSLVSVGDTGGTSEVTGSTAAGTVVSGNTQDAITYVNRFTPAQSSLTGDGNLTVTKQLTGRDLAAGQFSFTLSGADGAPMPTEATVSNDANGAVSFGTITFDKVGTYRYTLTEVQGTAAGYTYDGTSYTLVATVSKNASTGALDVAWAIDGSADRTITFANSYAASGGTDITATKTLTGRAMTEGEFSFAVVDGAGTTVATAQSPAAADGQAATVDFGTFSYSTAQIAADVASGAAVKTADGSWTYAYNAREDVSALPGGVTATAAAFEFTVTVVDNGDGTLTATPTYPTGTSGAPGIAFANTYGTDTVQLNLIGSKILSVPEGLTGPDDITGAYTFTLSGAAGAPMPDTATATNEKSGTVSFVPITFSQAGTYAYTVTESGTVAGVTNDSVAAAGKTVTVKVTDDGVGHLSAAVVDAAGKPVEGAAFSFTNTYSAQSTTAEVSVAKVLTVPEGLTGPASVAGAFTFTLSADTADAPLPTTTRVTNPDGSGTAASFGAITFTKPGTYVYRVTESGSVAGVTNDAAAATGKTVAIKVTDDGKGALTASAVDTVTFTNTYDVKAVVLEGSSSLQVTKAVAGHDAPNGFSFTLAPQFTVEGSGVIIPAGATTAQTGAVADGSSTTLAFGALTFTKPGTFSFTISEDGADGNGWTCDQRTHEATVVVTDNGAGKLVASVIGNNPTVTNTYKADSVTLTGDAALTVTKAVSGYGGTEAYTFTLALASGDASGVAIAAGGSTASTTGTIANGSSQTVAFGDVTFSKVGTYAFTVKEQTGSKAGWTYDTSAHDITVVVTYDGKGQLVAKVTGNNPTFTNTYKAAAADPVTLTATKTLSGATLVAGQFSFELRDADGSLVRSASNDANGLVSFGPLTFFEPGTYVYTMSEVKGSLGGITYDDSAHKVVVSVTDSGSGKLVAAVTEGANPTFANAYTSTSGALALTAQKVLDGRMLADGQFSFQLYDEQGAPVGEAVTNNAAGSVTFPGITYTQDDFAGVEPAADGSRTKQFTYTAKELASQQPGYTYASTTATYTVTAVDRGGSITATVDAAQNATFTNTYAATSVTAAPFTAVKTLEGRALVAGEFTFQLVDEAGDVVQTATNAADGMVAFAPITYTQEDLALATSKMFTYTLSEVGNGVGGVTYDTATHTASVTVTDNGDGTLSASGPVYDTQQAPKFANTYKVVPAAVALPTATKTVSGDESDAYPTFSFTIEALDGAPVPEGAVGAALARTLEGPGTVDFGSVTFTDEGTYRYRISETAGDADGWAYDATVYTVTYKVTDAGDGTFTVERSIVKDASGEAVDAVAFQNGYTAPAAPDDPAAPDKSKPEVATTPATGDGLPIVLLVALTAAAGVAAVGAAKRRQAHATSAHGRGAHRR